MGGYENTILKQNLMEQITKIKIRKVKGKTITMMKNNNSDDNKKRSLTH